MTVFAWKACVHYNNISILVEKVVFMEFNSKWELNFFFCGIGSKAVIYHSSGEALLVSQSVISAF